MEQDKHRFKQLFIVALTLFVVMTGWLGALLIRSFLTGHYMAAYPFIPFFFFLCGLGFVAALHRAEQKRQSMVRMVLMLKVARIAASIIILGLYAWLAEGKLFDFAVTYLIFYLLYMIFEMVALLLYEKDRKKQREMKL